MDQWLIGKKKVFLVCDSSLPFLKELYEKINGLETPTVRFSEFSPNPLYESVVDAVALLRQEECDSIIAVGGGSAMDVAKCVKLFSGLPGDGKDGSFLKAKVFDTGIPFLAIPTTAGTGSEATRYAVLYYQGEKQSIADDSLIPETVLMDPGVLESLPAYQKKATMLDALCHAIEAFWSINSTEKSRGYSRQAIEMIMRHSREYLSNVQESNREMLLAAHIAGKAINITQTTAGHAMCYKITSLFNCAHGHAAALCDRILFPWMIQNTGRCIDRRGETYLRKVLDEIGEALGGRNAEEGAQIFNEFFDSLELPIPLSSEAQFDVLKNSVNPTRLKNHPVNLDLETIDMLYHQILKQTP